MKRKSESIMIVQSTQGKEGVFLQTSVPRTEVVKCIEIEEKKTYTIPIHHIIHENVHHHIHTAIIVEIATEITIIVNIVVEVLNDSEIEAVIVMFEVETILAVIDDEILIGGEVVNAARVPIEIVIIVEIGVILTTVIGEDKILLP
jgi:hypothetical protein